MTPRVLLPTPEPTRDQMTIGTQSAMAYIYNPSIWGKEAEESGIQGQPRVHSKLQNSMGYNKALSQNTAEKGWGEGKEMTSGKVTY